ncbi:LuxR C-terminal-related transcriptional regulator [Aldersonia sp. NBC_00410]|uniref:helix-turn-helix transcriptional regulator n=1 Tax=Aldersonia sp. NBC_00410 TaxID=2975954 RepID=UPI00225879B6|nr:LuxR C-terminal-related transcriptional regulator [Aldersonia sp. NBC_00410]MCX5043536.1 LuxR C-terminal-related transcriptional regulator [Aldersonia sp. NBC_00410]
MLSSNTERLSSRARRPVRNPESIVHRARLHHALTGALTGQVPVVSICAPAGSGKTTLLVDWADRLAHTAPRGPSLAWATLTERHNSAAAIRAEVHAAVSEAIGFGTAGDSHHSAALENLAAGLQAIDTPIWLVLDDTHVLHDPGALTTLEQYLRWDHPQLRIVLAGRYEPPLALQRMRMEQRILEIGYHDLAFTAGETAAMLAEHQVRLSERDLDKLMARTEGWAAGVRLAGMSLASHPDPARLLADFSGDHRAVADYLIDEVLTGQPEHVREFLLRTSIAEEFTADLAEQLTGNSEARRILGELERRNCLITRTAEAPPAYRYHPLLRDYLRAEVGRIGRSAVEQLEHVAAGWYAQFGDALLALEHALKAASTDDVLTVLEQSGLSLVLDGHGTAVSRFIARASRNTREQPLVQLICAAAALAEGSASVARSILAEYDRGAAALEFDTTRTQTRRLATLRAALMLQCTTFDGDAVPDAADTAAAAAGSGDAELDAFALLQAGLAEHARGRLDAAAELLESAVQHARIASGTRIVQSTLAARARLQLGSGSLTTAEATANEILEIARHEHSPDGDGVHTAWLTLAWCDFLRAADTEAAAGHAQLTADRLRTHNPGLAREAALLARLCRVDDAPADRATARAVYESFWATIAAHPAPGFLELATIPVVHALLRAGETGPLTELLRWTTESATRSGEPETVRAIVDLSANRPSRVRDTLSPIIAGTVICASSATLVSAVVTEAINAAQRNHTPRAHWALTEALRHAAAEQVVRPFVDASGPVRALLIAGTGRFGRVEEFAAQVRSALPTGDRANEPIALTVRELELLRELPSWRTADQIAADMCLSVNTVKTHLRGIYRKLDVTSRRAAVARAQSLGLL